MVQAVLLALPLAGSLCRAESAGAPVAAEPVTLSAAVELPDSPGVAAAGSSSESAPQSGSTQPSLSARDQRAALPYTASPLDVTIAPGQAGPPQTVRDKVFSSFKDSVSPLGFLGDLGSAGYSQVTNGRPNYGTNSTAFAQRFGATVARGTSQKIFYEGVLAPLLHEDSRYYQLGSRQPFLKRVVYAGTRPLIGRTDSGRTTPNYGLLAAYLGSAALTPLYSPQRNQTASEVFQTWGSSVGGAALGNVVTEFLPDALEFLHLKWVRHP